ncbi:MAG: phosphoribosylglycinamide formyltransferase [Deltaproteobacteria bacterium]|nr:phosphoribosylglycinamide formyltransferase [Deltaproteobacteria bacterium]
MSGQQPPLPPPQPPPQLPLPLAVLASGAGSTLQAILQAARQGTVPVQVRLVVSDRPGAGALAIARAEGVAARVVPPGPAADAHLCTLLGDAAVWLVVLAGYLRRVGPLCRSAFPGRMINLHPSLLPLFGGRGMYGEHVHRAVLAAGAKVSGATVHLVDESYDTGPLLAQWPVAVLPGDTVESLAARLRPVEHRLLLGVLRAIACGLPLPAWPGTGLPPWP